MHIRTFYTLTPTLFLLSRPFALDYISAIWTRLVRESEKTSKHYDEAISLLNKVLSKAPETPFAKKANEEIKNIETIKIDDSVTVLINSGDGMYEKNQFDSAIAEYGKIIENFPKSKYEIIAKARILKAQKEKANAWIDLGKGLAYRKVGFRNQMGMFTEVYGELKNSSGSDMSVAILTVSVYDADDNLLGNGPIPVNNFPNNRITNFTGMVQVQTNKISSFKIQFDSGM
jgi:tetratricopeptide (TPR) repeat protein